MAQRVEVTLIDDLDGSNADETITFGLDGATYQIDLSKSNAGKLRKALEQYVGVARRQPGTRSRRSGAAASNGPGSETHDPAENKAIRKWAQFKGIEVPSRGRIPQTIREQYRKEAS